MIWLIVIGIIVFIIFRFVSDLNKDNYDLQGKTLNEKFSVIANLINEAAFGGRGTITIIDKRSFNLYEKGKSQIINFQYGTGHLTLTWRYKYFQKEIVHKKQFSDVRNLSIFEQQKIADIMISEMEQIVKNHKNNVIDNAF